VLWELVTSDQPAATTVDGLCMVSAFVKCLLWVPLSASEPTPQFPGHAQLMGTAWY
jgi:hypothetical protein